jgi:spermidine synthase
MTIVGGDARLSLERAAPSRFDVLVLDAFSSDAVPVHLLTREAFALYARHLRDAQSLLAVHASNRYLDLEGIIEAGAAASGFTSVVVENDLVDDETERTTWMLLARDRSALTLFGEPYGGTGLAPWTDASSNLLSVLRRD